MEKSEAIRSLRDDAGHWFARAAAMRKLAVDISNPEARRKMLAVADNYMRNAREAQARADVAKAGG